MGISISQAQLASATSDALDLVALAKSFPRLQNLSASELSYSETSWGTVLPGYTNVSQPPLWCSFKGVTCGSNSTDAKKYRRIIGINLTSLDLKGSIPALDNLDQMTLFNLDNNSIYGTIPPGLFLCPYRYTVCLNSISRLDLSNNQLTGTIPRTLDYRTGLVVLNLGSNQLAGTIPSTIGILTNLKELHLDHNRLTGTIPSFLRDKYRPIGTAPSTIIDLILLDPVSLFNNTLNRTIGSPLTSSTGLQILNLGSNRLTGTIPSSLGKLFELASLFLDNNILSGTIPPLAQSKLGKVLLNDNFLTMGSLTSVPRSTFSYNASIIQVQNNCLVFNNPANSSQNTDAFLCRAIARPPTPRTSPEQAWAMIAQPPSGAPAPETASDQAWAMIELPPPGAPGPETASEQAWAMIAQPPSGAPGPETASDQAWAMIAQPPSGAPAPETASQQAWAMTFAPVASPRFTIKTKYRPDRHKSKRRKYRQIVRKSIASNRQRISKIEQYLLHHSTD